MVRVARSSTWLLVSVALMGVVVLAGTRLMSAEAAKAQDMNGYRVARVQLGKGQRMPNGPAPGTHALVAFVQTDSSDPCVLATLNEFSAKSTPRVRYLSASVRKYGGNWGVIICLALDDPISDDVVAIVTLAQRNARFFKPPIAFIGG